MLKSNRVHERALHMKLERSVNALIRSARQHVIMGQPWPTQCTVPSKKLTRVAAVMNQLARPLRKPRR